MKNSTYIGTVAVLGSGVMGAQIAAHLINAGIKTWIFDLPVDETTHRSRNSRVQQALQNLTKLKPAPLGRNDLANYIQAANYQDDLNQLQTCDLVIEAIAERLDLKQALYQQITPMLAPHAILVTNTSGLSIHALSEVLVPSQQERFCGVHFFNPPRYMSLVEIISGPKTDSTVLASLENFLVTTLGKQVIYAYDTPNFIANRVGVFSMLSVMHRALQYHIPLEVVDALTGVKIGRPKSATFRTADVVGLDILAHVVATMDTRLTDDPWHPWYKLPAWLQNLISQGALGQKTGVGIYRKQGDQIEVFDIELNNYRPATKKPTNEVLELLKESDFRQKLIGLQKSDQDEAKFLWASFLDLWHFCAYHADTIAANVRDIDFAMRFGFGWQQGPFELWQQAGFNEIIQAITEAIKADHQLANVGLPAWVTTPDITAANGVYHATGAYQFDLQQFVPRTSKTFYKRQWVKAPALAEPKNAGVLLWENNALRLWQCDEASKIDIAILSFKTKLNTVNLDILESICDAIHYAEERCAGLVLWQKDAQYFSAGADLSLVTQALQQDDLAAIERAVKLFQAASLALRYARIPTIAAVRGMALGGGCEWLMHCTRVVAAFESYIGLVETGVGLLPAGGGCKEVALRAAALTLDSHARLRLLETYCQNIAKAAVSQSALEARQMGFLRDIDVIVMHPDEVLSIACLQARAISDSGYRPPLTPKIKVVGNSGFANVKAQLLNWQQGGFITTHDQTVTTQFARVLYGADLPIDTEVSESWLLAQECQAFLALCQERKTQARIEALLSTGKPIRN